MMNPKQLRQLTYTSGLIAVAGVLLATLALDRVNMSAHQADTALEVGAVSPTIGPHGTSSLAMVLFERSNDQVSRATLALALMATLTPLLLFLNVLRFTRMESGHYRPRPSPSSDP